MTKTAVSVLLSWASKATKTQQQEMARLIEEASIGTVLDSYDINAYANQILLNKIV